jgi:hypothetical protein
MNLYNFYSIVSKGSGKTKFWFTGYMGGVSCWSWKKEEAKKLTEKEVQELRFHGGSKRAIRAYQTNDAYRTIDSGRLFRGSKPVQRVITVHVEAHKWMGGVCYYVKRDGVLIGDFKSLRQANQYAEAELERLS